MPELPEIETITRGLDREVVGQVVTKVEVLVPKMFVWNSLKESNLEGAKIINVKRVAKMVVMNLSSDTSLVFHLKLTGQLIYQDKKTRIAGGHPLPPLNLPVPNKTTHIIFTLKGKDENIGHLYFNDLRKFGWVKFVPTSKLNELTAIGEEGPDPFEKKWTLEEFKTRLAHRKNAAIKPLLMDQKFLAGVGNIYSDEALWLAKIHPKRAASSLTSTEVEKLYQAIKESLTTGIKHKGAPSSSYVNLGGEKGVFLTYANAYHRTGLPCNRCKTPIIRLKIGSRSAHFCPACQTLSNKK